MVPMLTCGLVRSNLALATVGSSCCGFSDQWICGTRWRSAVDAADRLLAANLLDDLVGDVLGNLGVRVELHRVRRLTGGLGPQVPNVPEHLGHRHKGLDHAVARALVHRVDLP